MSVASQQAYYVERLIQQYRYQPNARATIALFAGEILANDLPALVNAAFVIDTATGNQLDIIGKYVGLPRNIGEPDPQPYYDFSDYDGTVRENGFRDYEGLGVNAQAVWYQYQFTGTRNTDLSDASYRFMLKWKILLNSNTSTLADITNAIYLFFGNSVTVQDNTDMTLTYFVTTPIPVPVTTLSPYLPRPMGVGITVDFMAVELDTYSVSKTNTYPASNTPTTDPVTATVAGGVAPLSYSWQLLTSDGLVGGLWANSPDSSATTFTGYFPFPVPPDRQNISTWRCIVTDSLSFVAYSPAVTVTTRYRAAV